MPASEIIPQEQEQENPLMNAMDRVLGKKKKTNTGGVIGYDQEQIGYDPDQAFRPVGDVINLSSAPGSGATTAESWSHDIALSNLKQQQLEFEYQQQQAALAAAQKAEESARAQAQLKMQQQTAAQQAALSPVQLQAAQLGNQATTQQMALAKQDAANKQKTSDLDYFLKTGIRSPEMSQNLASAATRSIGNLTSLSQSEQMLANRYMSAGLSPSQAYSAAYYGPSDQKLNMAAQGYNPQTGSYYPGIADMNRNNQRMTDAYYTSIGVDPATISGAFSKAVRGNVGYSNYGQNNMGYAGR